MLGLGQYQASPLPPWREFARGCGKRRPRPCADEARPDFSRDAPLTSEAMNGAAAH